MSLAMNRMSKASKIRKAKLKRMFQCYPMAQRLGIAKRYARCIARADRLFDFLNNSELEWLKTNNKKRTVLVRRETESE
jgi:hypothetical protein